MKFIKENMYRNGRGKIPSCLNILLQQVLGSTPAISLTIFFCRVKAFPLWKELPDKIIPYFIIERKYA